MEYYVVIGTICMICISTYFFRVKTGSVDGINGLDRNTTLALKGIAIVTIITHHLVQKMSVPGILLPYKGLGYLATGIFFFLSGYGLSEQYIISKETDKTYWIKRISNVYIPLIITMVSLHVLLNILKGSWQTLFVDIVNGIFGHWYIRMLSVWYAVFFIVLKICRDNRKRVICFWVMAAIIYAICVWLGAFKTYYDTIWCFPIGVCWSLYYSDLYKILKKYWKWSLGLSFMLMAVFACYSFQKLDYIAVFVRSLSSIMLIVWLLSFLMFVNIENNTVAKFWGRISYAVFLIHIYFLQDANSIGIVILYYGVCIILGYAYTEMYQRIKKGLLK